jgi:AcrR family transcriptional regulator
MDKPGPRERLLTAARELCDAEGVTVGVDAILRHAGVARRSLYDHFGGKDQLIATMLRDSANEDEQRYRRFLDRGGDDPRARVLALFDALDEVTSAPGYRGCRFSRAEFALTSPEHPAHVETRRHKRTIRALLRDELVRLGNAHPDQAADQLQLLVEGVLITGALKPGSHPALDAKPMVARVLDTTS